MKEEAYKRGYSINDWCMVPRSKDTFIGEENQPEKV
jgi:hypothetical protein